MLSVTNWPFMLSINMLNVVMLSVVILKGIVLSVVMLNVVAPRGICTKIFITHRTNSILDNFDFHRYWFREETTPPAKHIKSLTRRCRGTTCRTWCTWRCRRPPPPRPSLRRRIRAFLHPEVNVEKNSFFPLSLTLVKNKLERLYLPSQFGQV